MQRNPTIPRSACSIRRMRTDGTDSRNPSKSSISTSLSCLSVTGRPAIIRRTVFSFTGRTAAPVRSREVSVGVIGTKDGLSYFRNWAIALGGFVAVPPPKKTDKENRLHLSNFPGLEEAFGIMINPGEFVERTVDAKALDDATRTLNQHEAVRKAVDLYVNEIERYDSNEEKTVNVWIFILPEIVFERCKPLARRSGIDLTKGEFTKSKKEKSDLPLLRDVIDQSAEDVFNDVPDFHRQVKARLLKLGHTSQLIRETTLVPDKFLNRAGYPIRGLQDPATVAWNLATGLYYKTQPEPPWKLAHVRRVPLAVEEEKEARLRGFYIHPDLHGAPAERQIEWARHPQTIMKMRQQRQQMKQEAAKRLNASAKE